MGALPDYSLLEHPDPDRGQWDKPCEPASDGCPKGWALSPFVQSVLRFYRQRDKSGNRIVNPFFDRGSWLVQQAVLYLEQFEDRWNAEVEKVVFKPRKE